MRRSTIKLLIAFIRTLLSVLVYQANIISLEHRTILITDAKKLIDALESE